MSLRHPDFDPQAFALGEPAWQLDLPDEAATRALGAWFAVRLTRGDFFGLIGSLGAGKTTLVTGLVHALDPEAEVHSPTYTLINHYATSPPLAHMDLYRLENYDDLESIGYWDVIDSRRHVACVEWFSRIPDSWPDEGAVLLLERVEPAGRRATLWCADASPIDVGSLTRRIGEPPTDI